jgi:hypothetical protein
MVQFGLHPFKLEPIHSQGVYESCLHPPPHTTWYSPIIRPHILLTYQNHKDGVPGGRELSYNQKANFHDNK